MSSKSTNTSRFYPGNIWFKRLGYLALVFSIGLNFYIGQIQDEIISKVEDKTNDIESTTDSIIALKVPNLNFLRMKDGSFKKGFYNAIKSGLDFFDVETVSAEDVNKIAESSEKIKMESEKINTYTTTIKGLLQTAIDVIKITSNLIWISILWALFWLYLDIKKGNAKGFVKLSLVVAIPFNFFVFHLLSNHLTTSLIPFG